MILRIYERVGNIHINRQMARVVRVFNRNVPSGIMESEFTGKGTILVGTGDGEFIAVPPGDNGTYLKFDDTEPAGVKSEVPTFTVDDTTNHLINGGFMLAQRQAPATLTTISNESYGADRWKMTRENADLQYRRVDASAESGLTSPYYGEYKKITNSGKIMMAQILENFDTLKFRGKEISFQIKMKASTDRIIKIAIAELQTGGTADTIPTLVSVWSPGGGSEPTLGTNLALIGTAEPCSVTSAWQTFTFSGTFPATSKNLLVLVYSATAFAANDTLSLAEAGLYFGVTQRTWTPRPISQEILLAQRYYRKSYAPDTAPGTASQSGVVYGFASSTSVIRPMRPAFNPIYMRTSTAPTYTVYSYAGTVNKVSTMTPADIGTSVTGSGNNSSVDSLTDSGAGLTSGAYYMWHYAASAEL